jgi:hypothetical protein
VAPIMIVISVAAGIGASRPAAVRLSLSWRANGRNGPRNFLEVARSLGFPSTGILSGMGEEEATYSAAQAAKVLGVSRRMVLNYVHEGTLEGFREMEGGAWKVFQRSVHALRDNRPATNRPREDAESPVEAREWSDRVEALARELGRLEGEFRARQELTEITESTLREQLERERERADRLEGALEAERSKGFWARLFGR